MHLAVLRTAGNTKATGLRIDILKNSYKQQGFSLIELMVTLAVLLILVVVAIPSFQQTMVSIRSSALVDGLVSALNLTRSEAIKRNSDVRLCASSNGTECKGNDWSVGWVVLVVDSGTVLRYWKQANSSGKVDLKNNNDKQLDYNAEGEASLDGSTANIEFITQISGCDKTPLNAREHQRKVTVSAAGFIKVEREKCS